jgi:excisionase family DNA binding protein
MAEEIYTIEEVADILKVSQQTVRKLIREKKLRTVRVGVQIRIRQSEIDRFLSGSD